MNDFLDLRRRPDDQQLAPFFRRQESTKASRPDRYVASPSVSRRRIAPGGQSLFGRDFFRRANDCRRNRFAVARIVNDQHAFGRFDSVSRPVASLIACAAMSPHGPSDGRQLIAFGTLHDIRRPNGQDQLGIAGRRSRAAAEARRSARPTAKRRRRRRFQLRLVRDRQRRRSCSVRR